MDTVFFMRSKSSQEGSYTIEACISLVAFIIAIMFIYAQIKGLICESIMQSAVNNMAKETASYVYILDRMGLVIQHSDDDLEYSNSVIDDVSGNVNQLTDDFNDLLSTLFGDGGAENITSITSIDGSTVSGDASSIADSIKNIINVVKNIDVDKVKAEGPDALIYGAESGAKALGNTSLAAYYKWKLSAYLPSSMENFCKFYSVDPNTISFSLSRVFPTDKNNTVLVAVEYDTSSVLLSVPVKRHVVKYAYTAAWVKSNAN